MAEGDGGSTEGTGDVGSVDDGTITATVSLGDADDVG